MTGVTFFVRGNPRPGGSKRYVGHYYNSTVRKHVPLLVDDCDKNPFWRNTVAATAREAMAGRKKYTGALELSVVFYLPRPKSHYGVKGLLPSAREHPIVKPDTTKLMRSTEDALTGIVWKDDAQVVEQTAIKRYVRDPSEDVGALINVNEINMPALAGGVAV